MSLYALKPYPVATSHRNLVVISPHGAHRGRGVPTAGDESLPPPVRGGRGQIPVESVIEGEVLKPVFRAGKGVGDQFVSRLLLSGSVARSGGQPNAAAIAAYRDNAGATVSRDATARYVNVFV